MEKEASSDINPIDMQMNKDDLYIRNPEVAEKVLKKMMSPIRDRIESKVPESLPQDANRIWFEEAQKLDTIRMKEIKINISLYEDSRVLKPDKTFTGAFFYNDLLPQKYLSENLDTCWRRVKSQILQELYGEE